MSKPAKFLRVGGSLNCDQLLMRVVLPRLKATESSVNLFNITTQVFLCGNSIFPKHYEQADAALYYLCNIQSPYLGYYLPKTDYLLFLSFILHSFLFFLHFN